MRSILIFLVSAVLSAGVIANAVIQKKQFYPSVVYISKSNPSMAVSFRICYHSPKKMFHHHNYCFSVVSGNLFSIVDLSFDVGEVDEKGKYFIAQLSIDDSICFLLQIFLGTLRAAEFEHLMERFWYALTETCLAFTVFRDDFNPKFIALFTVLLFLKSFHWLAEDRVDYVSV